MGLILLIVLILLLVGAVPTWPHSRTGDMRPAEAWVDCPDSNNPLVTARVLNVPIAFGARADIERLGPADQLAPPFHRYDIPFADELPESRLLSS